MIEFYTWATPNGRKVAIMLEEAGLPYTVHPIDITGGAQRAASYLKLNPRGKIPVIVDRENGMVLSESGAILYYLADKVKRFLPSDRTGRWKALEWMMFQMAHVGPMLGQVHHFVRFNPGKSEYAEQRYLNEAMQLYSMLDARLEDEQFLAGDYSIVDMATWPWIARFDWQTMDLNAFPGVKRWYCEIAGRPAVQAAWQVPPSNQPLPMP